MKARNLTTTVKNIGLVILTVFFLTISIKAQNAKVGNQELSKSAIENLVAGIKSSNDGVKRDCIYYAAIYGIHDAIDVLKAELKKEKNSSTRVLIALALFKLGENTQTEDLSGYVLIDWDEKVRDIREAFADTDSYKNTVTVTDNKK